MSAPTITISPDYTPGATLNSQLKRAQPPFKPDSFRNIFSDNNFNKLEPAQSGKFEQRFEATLTASEKVKALGVSGQLDLSYGPVSGDANLKFAMDNTKDQFSLSVIYSTTRTGKERRVDGAQLDTLELDGPVLAEIKKRGMTLDEFRAKYGKYVVIGYEYGGCILFDLTYSCDSSGDKMGVAGGLSVAYDKVPGFSISGSVEGDYKQEDINKSSKNKVKTSIQPSSISAKQTELVKLFNKLSNAGSEEPNTLAKYKEEIDGRINELLNPENGELDKVKAIIIDIENIRCVSRAQFVSAEAKQRSISYFIKFANALYMSVKSQFETIQRITAKWTNDPPVKLLKEYGVSLSKLEQFMGTLNDENEIYKYAKLYHSYLNPDSEGDNANIETKDDTDGRRQIDIPARDFYKIDKYSFDAEFEQDISKPYENRVKDDAEDDTKYNNDEAATMAYKDKKIKRWSNSDLLNWVKSLGLSKKWQSVMVEAIMDSGCTGQDFAALESDEQLGTSLNITIPMLYKRVFREMEKVKKEQEDAAVSAAMSNLGSDNNSSNNTGGSTTKSSLSYGKAIEQKDGKFELCIFGQSKYWTLKEKATKDTKVRRVQELYKDAAAIDKPIEDIVLMAKGKTLAPDKTLGYYGIVGDRHTITVKFKVVGGTEAASIAYLCFFI